MKVYYVLVLWLLSGALGQFGGKLELNVHYPDARLPCPTSSILASNEIGGWDVVNETTFEPFPQVLMKHIAPDHWQLVLPYPEALFTNKISSRFVLYNPCAIAATKALKDTPNIPFCSFQPLTRDIGKGHTIYLQESGVTIYEAYPYFCQTVGEIRNFPDVPAPQLPGGKRTIGVYVPPGLVENPIGRSVSMLYLYDGQSLSSISMLDSFIISGAIRELVVVGIPSTVNRSYELTPTVCNQGSCSLFSIPCTFGHTGGYSNTVSFIENNVHPLVLSNLSITSTDVGSAGWSFGGLAACEGLYRSTLFTKAYCGSPSLWWNCNEYTRLHTYHPAMAKAYVDAGTGERIILQSAQATFHVLQSIDGFAEGGNLWFKEVEGDYHEYSSWISRLLEAFSILYN